MWEGVLQISDIFSADGFMLICVFIIHLPILLSCVEVLFSGCLGLKLLFMAMSLFSCSVWKSYGVSAF
jgi:hypothetical protein